MNISDDRIKELREFVHSRTRDIDHFDPDGWNKRADLLSVLDDYSALKAENERLRIAKDGLRESLGICCAMGKEHKARAEKAEAENDKLITELSHHQHDLFYEKQAREKAEAELVDEQKRRAAIAESLQDHQDEIERLRADCAVATKMLDLADGIIEKQGAELLTAQMTNAKNGAVIIEQMAQLAKVAPLIEAANKWDGRVADWASIKPLIQSVDDYRAALALREEKK
jgi:predicted  nucleic acid-binding Zn-ribbon protein